MTGVGTDQVRNLGEFVDDTRKRLVALERRQIGAGGGGGGGANIIEGPGIDITGSGSSGSPYVISADAPALPDPQATSNANAFTLTAANGVWQDIPGLNILTITPPRDLWVRVDFTAMTFASTGYTAIGVAWSANGGAYSSPPTDEMTANANGFGQSPFNVVRESATGITGNKMMKLTAGTVYAFKMQTMRSASTGSQQANYAIMRVVPMYWVNTPVPVRVTSGALTRRSSSVVQNVTTSSVSVVYGTSEVNSGHFTVTAGNDGFTCIVAGTYRITAITGFSTATSSYVSAYVRVNGVIRANIIGTRSTLQVGIPITVTANLNLGDVVSVTFQSNVANGSTDVTLARTFIELIPVVANETTVVLPATSGLIPLTATSVASTGGTASNVGNKVSFTGVNAVSLNEVFQVPYDDYVIEVVLTSKSVAGGGWFRFRTGGVDDAVASSYGNQWNGNSTASAQGGGYNVDTGFFFTSVAFTNEAKIKWEVSGVRQAVYNKTSMISTMGWNASFAISQNIRGVKGGVAADGFSLVSSSGTITGYLRVYGLA